MNCTVGLIYIKKLQQTNASTQTLPFHSDSLSPTQSLPSLQPLAGSPRRRDGVERALFFLKEDSTAHVPTTSSGLGRRQLNSPAWKLFVFQVFKTEEMCFSQGIWITKSR